MQQSNVTDCDAAVPVIPMMSQKLALDITPSLYQIRLISKMPKTIVPPLIE
jgi:hypothetical protein